MVTIVSIRNSLSPGNFLSTWMTVTFAILAAQPMCMALNFEAVLRLEPICTHGWIAWITAVSPPLPSNKAAEWSEQLTSRRVGWLGAATVGSIPALVTFCSFSSLLLFLSSLSKPIFLLSIRNFTNTWLLPNFHGLLHHLTWAFRLPSIFKLWLPPISNAGQACHTQQMSPFFTLVAQSEPAWESRILLPSGSRCRLCAWTFCNNPLTVVAPACMTDFCSARNGGRVGVHQQLSMHAHRQS